MYALLLVLVLALCLLYQFSAAVRYVFRFLFYYVTVIIYPFFPVMFLCFRPTNPYNGMLATIPLRILNPLLGLHWQVRGVEHITPDRAAIVVANHQSSIDFLGMVYMWPMFQKISAIAKKEILYAVPFGPTAWLCGTRFIDRSNPTKSKQSMNEALEYVTNNKVKLWIFPEGTRNMKDEMLPFKKGAFHLALSGHLPILPVVYSSYRGFLSHKAKVFNPGNIIVTCLPPISTEGLSMDDMPKLMEDVQQQMMKVFRESSQEVVQPYPLEPDNASKHNENSHISGGAE